MKILEDRPEEHLLPPGLEQRELRQEEHRIASEKWPRDGWGDCSAKAAVLARARQTGPAEGPVSPSEGSKKSTPTSMVNSSRMRRQRSSAHS